MTRSVPRHCREHSSYTPPTIIHITGMPVSEEDSRVATESDGSCEHIPTMRWMGKDVDEGKVFPLASAATMDLAESSPSSMEVDSRLHHLKLSCRIIERSKRALGNGAFSEVFRGRCLIEGRGETDVAIKRLRFHVETTNLKRVRIGSSSRVSSKLTMTSCSRRKSMYGRS